MSDLSFNWFWLLEKLWLKYFLMILSIKNGGYASFGGNSRLDFTPVQFVMFEVWHFDYCYLKWIHQEKTMKWLICFFLVNLMLGCLLFKKKLKISEMSS